MQKCLHLDTGNVISKEKEISTFSTFHCSSSLAFLETEEKHLCNLSLMTIKVQSHYPLSLNCLLFKGLIEGMTHCYRNWCAHPS